MEEPRAHVPDPPAAPAPEAPMSTKTYERRMKAIHDEHDRRADRLPPGDTDAAERLDRWLSAQVDRLDARFMAGARGTGNAQWRR